MKALVHKIIPFSSVDGPGNRMAIFLQGCNFNCLYCHNPETINICSSCGVCLKVCPQKALNMKDGKVVWDENRCIKCDECIKTCPNNSSPKVKEMTVDDILKEIRKYRAFISGITVSGGECTLHNNFLAELFKEVKKMNLNCFIDTNGYIPFVSMPELIELSDGIMLDVKSIDDKEHIMLTGKSNNTVIENLYYIGRIGKLYEVRTVVVPDLLDNKRNVREISRIIASINKEIRYKIIKFRPLGVRGILKSSPIPSDDFIKDLNTIAMYHGLRNIIIT